MFEDCLTWNYIDLPRNESYCIDDDRSNSSLCGVHLCVRAVLISLSRFERVQPTLKSELGVMQQTISFGINRSDRGLKEAPHLFAIQEI